MTLRERQNAKSAKNANVCRDAATFENLAPLYDVFSFAFIALLASLRSLEVEPAFELGHVAW